MKMFASLMSFLNCSKLSGSRSSSRMYPEHSTATSGCGRERAGARRSGHRRPPLDETITDSDAVQMQSTCSGAHLARVDALARRRERRLVLGLEDHVDDLEDAAVADVVGHNLAVGWVAAGEQAAARAACGHHLRRGRTKHRRPSETGASTRSSSVGGHDGHSGLADAATALQLGKAQMLQR